jgi:hypothetical protein
MTGVSRVVLQMKESRHRGMHILVQWWLLVDVPQMPVPQILDPRHSFSGWHYFQSYECSTGEPSTGFLDSHQFFCCCFCETGALIQVFTPAKKVLYSLSHTSSPFCFGYFGDGVSWAIYLGCPWTLILSIPASQIVRIADMNHWYPVRKVNLKCFFE